MDTRWRIELFGGLRVQRGDRIVTHFETRKTAALLACLALHLHRGQGYGSRELLAEQLWPGEDPDATRHRFRQALTALRRVLEPPGTPPGSVLIADRAEVRLDACAVTSDVAEFEAAVHAAPGAATPAERAAVLTGAVELY